ncbi:MAG: hyaluronidase [Planctomycetaceae bacterium]|nr:hyaluronidase [Planctomycetaceae bacterium]
MRIFSRTAATGFLLSVVVLSAYVTEASTPRQFVVFDAMGYGQPDTSRYGMIRFVCFYYRLPGDKDKHLAPTMKAFSAGTLPPKADFIAAVQKHASRRTGPIVLDIEGIPLSGDPKVVKPRFTLFATLAKWAKEAAPDRIVGYYGHGLFPERPAKQYKAEAKELAAPVDAFFPSMYVFNDNREAWRKKLADVVAEARRIAPGKPVYPFVWPQYHDGTPQQFQFVTGEYWRWQLDTIRQCGADGVVLWGARRYPNAHVWNEQADWWQETLRFMKSLGDK